MRQMFVACSLAVVLAPCLKAGHHAAPGGAPHALIGSGCVTTCKIQTIEYVQVPVQVERVTYKQVCQQVPYTAYRCETYTEPCTKTITVNRMVPECVMEPRTRCIKVPVMTTKIEYKRVKKKVSYVDYRTKTVKRKYCVTECVEKKPGLFARLCGNTPCCPEYELKTRTKTCREKVCEPVCKTKTVRECVPVCKKVCTYKTKTVTDMVPVTRMKCVPQTKTITTTVCKTRKVPYTAYRTVTKCVPVKQCVTVMKCVPKCVTKEVPVCNPCLPACCNPCAMACCH